MYNYSPKDQRLVEERAVQFQDQTRRFLEKEISDEEYQQLRLRNGLYIQKHAPMLRVAIPYGLVSSKQLRKLAEIARRYDKGYGHFTTRQNIQFNWPAIEDVPAILTELAAVQMHAIQSSGSCIRNVTADQFAGVARDEIEDPRPWAELIRQWSTFHPEFNWLPRKFKIALSGAEEDRAATIVHDIGIRLVYKDKSRTEIGFAISVGGGLGRTPVIGSLIKPYLEKKHLLSYLEAILRTYNRFGRRDNKYKARIKILVRAMTPQVFAQKVEDEWQAILTSEETNNTDALKSIVSRFTKPLYKNLDKDIPHDTMRIADSKGFGQWLSQNTLPHKQPGYRIVNISLKPTGQAPGDVSDGQLDFLANLAEDYSFGEARITHEQNICLADVESSRLRQLWEILDSQGMATPNLGLLTDIICCPGGDYCSLANAKSIPVARAIQQRFPEAGRLNDLGNIRLNISGCMNACAHHHVGNIGILGVDKKGAEYYQVSIGGSSKNLSRLGRILGPSFSQEDIPAVIDTLVSLYETSRLENESFLDTFDRIGVQPFKDAVYGDMP
ncbi:MAG: nitrite/sulfite reductase [Gammaproteobacteria bacterium]|nr:nitrite/sulfite reductase [Gammaproteobacteria bacterium]